MKPILRIIFGVTLVALLAAVFLHREASVTPDAGTATRSSAPPLAGSLPATRTAPFAATRQTAPLLPAAVIPEPVAAIPSVPASAWQPANLLGRPVGESIMSSWAARDPEGAGHWLNQNRNHPQFADYVRGYAIQIAAIDPGAARQWAAQLNGTGNRFGRGGTLEQHIDALEQMLQNPVPDTAEISSPPNAESRFPADYTPVLVRQNPGEDPVLEMQPVSPLG